MNEQAFLEEGLEFLEERLTVQECLAETVLNAAEGEGKIRFQQVVGLASDHRDEDAEFSGVEDPATTVFQLEVGSPFSCFVFDPESELSGEGAGAPRIGVPDGIATGE